MSSIDIEEMHHGQIEDEIADWFLQLEREVPVPQEWIQKFGKLEQFRSFIDDLVYSHEQRMDEKSEIAEERESWREKYENLVEAVQEVVSDIEMIEELDSESDEDGATEKMVSIRLLQSVNDDIGKVIKSLDKAIDEGKPVPVKKNGKAGKRK